MLCLKLSISDSRLSAPYFLLGIIHAATSAMLARSLWKHSKGILISFEQQQKSDWEIYFVAFNHRLLAYWNSPNEIIKETTLDIVHNYDYDVWRTMAERKRQQNKTVFIIQQRKVYNLPLFGEPSLKELGSLKIESRSLSLKNFQSGPIIVIVDFFAPMKFFKWFQLVSSLTKRMLSNRRSEGISG